MRHSLVSSLVFYHWGLELVQGQCHPFYHDLINMIVGGLGVGGSDRHKHTHLWYTVLYCVACLCVVTSQVFLVSYHRDPTSLPV